MTQLSIGQIAALPDGRGPALDAAVARLVTAVTSTLPTSYQSLPTGAYGETVATRAREASIERAIRLVSSAPLNRMQRAAILNWIIDRPGARIAHDAKDRDGRRGRAISFRSMFDKQVPARTVTAVQLVDEARAAGGVDLPDTDSTKAWNVEAYRAYRRWVVGLVFDPATMRILQSQSVTQASHPVDIPELYLDRPASGAAGTYRFVVSRGNVTTGAGGGTLWYASEPVRTIHPMTPVCARVPRVCTK